MTTVLDESVSITYDSNEPVSPTAVGPQVIPLDPPAEDDSAGDLSIVSQFGEGAEADPKTAYEGYLMWGGVGEHLFTSQITKGVPSGLPNALSGLKQSRDAKEKGLSKSLQKAVTNILNDYKQPYNIHSMQVRMSPTRNEVESHQSTEHLYSYRAFFDAALFKQSSEDTKEEDLADALRDLQEINYEADEEGMPPPSKLAIANADRLIREIYDILPRQYLVELLPEGVIAITVPGGFRRSVMLLCESEGGALCSVNMSGSYRRKRYVSAAQLPDGFLREALSELGRE